MYHSLRFLLFLFICHSFLLFYIFFSFLWSFPSFLSFISIVSILTCNCIFLSVHMSAVERTLLSVSIETQWANFYNPILQKKKLFPRAFLSLLCCPGTMMPKHQKVSNENDSTIYTSFCRKRDLAFDNHLIKYDNREEGSI